MPYQLSVDYALIEMLRKMPAAQRRRIEEQLDRIQNYPANHTDFIYPDASGRNHNVSLIDGFAIYFWIDDADRHIKIMRIIRRSS